MSVTTTSSADEMMSQLLIAQLLEQDIDDLAALKAAEHLQVDLALAASAGAAGRISKFSKTSASPKLDADLALELLAADVRVQSDGIYAQSLLADDAAALANRQYALKVAASEQKLLLDEEFARRLENADDDVGMDVDAERLLGQEAVENILARNPNEKGKGKNRAHSPAIEPPRKHIKTEHSSITIKTEDRGDATFTGPHPLTCGICLEPFQATHSPAAASRSANSSSRIPFGICLPCPREHGYCVGCLTSYIQTKLDPEDDGELKSGTLVFPIRCPECPSKDWPEGIQDSIAERVLGEKGFVMWHHQKILDSIPRYYCPNRRCSALVQVHEDADEPQAICPSCQALVCVPCRVEWHNDFTCEQYQALPLDERSPEDQLVLRLAKAENWRRCPSCLVIVELTHGCNHITCKCGTHFCFRCGSLWDGKCTREPACDLWDESMLLEEQERRREREQQVPVAVRPYVAHPIPPPPYAFRPVPVAPVVRGAFDWIDDPRIICGRHWFTTEMINTLTCGYCDTKLNSLADLRYHLDHVRRHAVFACCGRFFKRDIDIQRHMDAYPRRFGEHMHTVRRDSEY